MNTVPMNIESKGPPPMEWQVHIDHMFDVDSNMHVLTCDQVQGFFVTSRDPEKLWTRAINTLTCLLKDNEDMDCTVSIPPEFSHLNKSGKSNSSSKAPIKSVTAIVKLAA